MLMQTQHWCLMLLQNARCMVLSELLFRNGCADVSVACGNLELVLLYKVDQAWGSGSWYLLICINCWYMNFEALVFHFMEF